MLYYTNSDELYHYGVKGMKWGIRKAINRQVKKSAARKKARVEKLKAKANQGVTNYYKNPIKMYSQTRARAKLYDMDTRKKMKGKGFVDRYAIKYERSWKRPALSITGKETTAGRAVAEGILLNIGMTAISQIAATSIAKNA